MYNIDNGMVASRFYIADDPQEHDVEYVGACVYCSEEIADYEDHYMDDNGDLICEDSACLTNWAMDRLEPRDGRLT